MLDAMAVCPECGEPITPDGRDTPTPDPGAAQTCPECHGAFVIDADGAAHSWAWGADAR